MNLIKINSFKDVKNQFPLNKKFKNLPYKEDWYLEKRYFNHPIYKYNVWGLKKNNSVVALLIGREINQNNSKILRFIDFIGEVDNLALLGSEIKKLIDQNCYEYIDFLLSGISESVMNRCGFILKKENDENIIPNYFEPFVQSNVDIWFETNRKDMILFKGDADGDRPNYR